MNEFMGKESRLDCIDECLVASGWIRDYRAKWCDPSSLQAEIDEYMMRFDEQVAKAREEQEANQGKPDEEGWVTVTRSKKPLKPEELKRTEIRRAKKKRKEKVTSQRWHSILELLPQLVSVGIAQFLPVSTARDKT